MGHTKTVNTGVLVTGKFADKETAVKLDCKELEWSLITLILLSCS